MGFGTAFATGLIKGFTQNIKEEEAKRLSERERLNRLDELLITASTKENANLEGIKSIASLIQSARTEMSQRKPIDIFGTASDNIDIDFAKMQGSITNATSYGTMYGTGANKIGFTTNLSKGIDHKLGRGFLSEVSSFMGGGSEATTKLDNLSDADMLKLWNHVTASKSAIQQHERSVTKELYVKPDFWNNYQGLEDFDKYASTRFKNGVPKLSQTDNSGVGNFSYDAINIGVDNVVRDVTANGGPAPTAVKIVQDENGGYVYRPVTFTKEADIQALSLVAQNMSQAMGMEVTPLNAIAIYQEAFMRIPGVSAEDQYNSFMGAMSLAKEMRFVTELDPDKQLKTIDQGTLDRTYKILKTADANSLQMMAYSLAPFMVGPKIPQDDSRGAPGEQRKVNRETIRKYIMRRIFGDEKAKTADWNELQTTQTALRSTNQRILELEKTLEGLDASNVNEAYLAFKKNLSGIFSLEGGFLGGLVADVKGVVIGEDANGIVNVNNDKALTREYGQLLQQRIDERMRVGGETAAKLEAMKVSLAFEMARAADPSGRLSNQDIEQQYRKLGGTWDTAKNALAALSVTKREFAIKEAQYDTLIRLGESTNVAYEKDYRIIDGTIAADYIIRNQSVDQNLTMGSMTFQRQGGVNKEAFGKTIRRLKNGNVVDMNNMGRSLTVDEIEAYEAWEKEQQQGNPVAPPLESNIKRNQNSTNSGTAVNPTNTQTNAPTTLPQGMMA